MINLQSKLRRHFCDVQLYWPRISSEAQESLEYLFHTPPPSASSRSTYHTTIQPMTNLKLKIQETLLDIELSPIDLPFWKMSYRLRSVRPVPHLHHLKHVTY